MPGALGMERCPRVRAGVPAWAEVLCDSGADRDGMGRLGVSRRELDVRWPGAVRRCREWLVKTILSGIISIVRY